MMLRMQLTSGLAGGLFGTSHLDECLIEDGRVVELLMNEEMEEIRLMDGRR